MQADVLLSHSPAVGTLSTVCDTLQALRVFGGERGDGGSERKQQPIGRKKTREEAWHGGTRDDTRGDLPGIVMQLFFTLQDSVSPLSYSQLDPASRFPISPSTLIILFISHAAQGENGDLKGEKRV